MTLDDKLSSTISTLRISNNQGKSKTNSSSSRRESSELQKSFSNMELEAGCERMAVTPAKKKKKETSNSTSSSPSTSRKKRMNTELCLHLLLGRRRMTPKYLPLLIKPLRKRRRPTLSSSATIKGKTFLDREGKKSKRDSSNHRVTTGSLKGDKDPYHAPKRQSIYEVERVIRSIMGGSTVQLKEPKNKRWQ